MIKKKLTICFALIFCLVFSLPCFGDMEKLGEKDFSFKEFGYGSDRTKIEKLIGEPTESLIPNRFSYQNSISLIYRSNKAVYIFVGVPLFKTYRGIKVGDNLDQIINVYGNPDKNDPDQYIEYDFKNNQNKNLDLILGFVLEKGKVKYITIADYQAANFMY